MKTGNRLECFPLVYILFRCGMVDFKLFGKTLRTTHIWMLQTRKLPKRLCFIEELTLSEEVYLIDTARLYLSIIKPAKDKMICFITLRNVKS